MKPIDLRAARWRRWLLPALLLGPLAAYAQTNVALGTTTPHASAVLEVSSSSQGLLLPRLTASQRAAIGSPATGLLVYQTDGSPTGFYFYNGTAWTALSSSAGTNGLNALVRNSAEAAGANCATGGTKVESGRDANGNGVLDAGEVTATSHVCAGAAGSTGAKGDKGTAGATGSTGATGAKGDAGPSVALGGTAGQLLSKASGTDYATQWSTAAGGSAGLSVQLRANKVGGTGESLPMALSPTALTIAFNNVLTAPALGTWDGSTYTVGTGGAGLYLIQAAALAPDNATPSNTVSPNLLLQVNGAAYGSTAGDYHYGIYPLIGTSPPAGTKARGELSRVVYLNAGDTFRIQGVSANSSTATPALSATAATNLLVVKLN
ncbi:collagen-like protein [Hymenobacter gummosus]|uniref:collagen-like protein n=1 Tax=Hymenobacter gummosus TaxID=1776032 RepID=UPI001A9DFD99|nr:collagen-like protein [Hymenobacter gummosus]